MSPAIKEDDIPDSNVSLWAFGVCDTQGRFSLHTAQDVLRHVSGCHQDTATKDYTLITEDYTFPVRAVAC